MWIEGTASQTCAVAAGPTARTWAGQRSAGAGSNGTSLVGEDSVQVGGERTESVRIEETAFQTCVVAAGSRAWTARWQQVGADQWDRITDPRWIAAGSKDNDDAAAGATNSSSSSSGRSTTTTTAETEPRKSRRGQNKKRSQKKKKKGEGGRARSLRAASSAKSANDTREGGETSQTLCAWKGRSGSCFWPRATCSLPQTRRS